jgi:hypothetical protein
MRASLRCLLVVACAATLASCIPFPHGKKPGEGSPPAPPVAVAPVEAAPADPAPAPATATDTQTVTVTGTATATETASSPLKAFEALWPAAAADDERRLAAFDGLTGPEVLALFDGPLKGHASPFYQLRVAREDAYAAAQQHFAFATSDDTVRMVCFRKRVFKSGEASDEPGTCRVMILQKRDGVAPSNLVQAAMVGDYRRVTAQMIVARDDEALAAVFAKAPLSSATLLPIEDAAVDKQALRIFCPLAERSCRIQLQVPR